MIKTFLNTAFITLITLVIGGCTKVLKNPELIDPIYRDIQKEIKHLDSMIKNRKKLQTDNQALLLEQKPRSLRKKQLQKEVRKGQAKMEALAQKRKYNRIKLARRKAESYISYKKALKDGVPWPNPSEYKYYLVHKNLRNAPSNWSSRVPKLFPTTKISEKVKK